jgi:hypothetical protein
MDPITALDAAGTIAQLVELSDFSGVYQSHAGRAIRIWPKIEMDELVFCLPEKKWMSIYVHGAHLAA